MSILKIRSLFDTRGCQVLLIFVAALVMVGLVFTGTCVHAVQDVERMLKGEEAIKPTIVRVGNHRVTHEEFASMLEATQRLGRNQPNAGDPDVLVGKHLAVLSSLVDSVVYAHIADELGAPMTDDSLLGAMSGQLDRLITEHKALLVEEGRLEADATAEQVAVAFRTDFGAAPDEFRTSQMDQIRAALADPLQRMFQHPQLAQRYVVGLYEGRVTTSDEEVKSSFDELMVRRLGFAEPGMEPADLRARADEAIAALQAGRSFDDVAREFAPNMPESPIPLRRSIVETSPSLKPVLELQPGEHTGLLEDFGQPVIFKLVEVRPNPPADFEERKEQYTQQFKTQRAMATLIEERRKILDSDQVVWESNGFRAVYSMMRFAEEGGGDAQERWLAFYEELGTVQDPAPIVIVPLALARHFAFEQYFRTLSPAERTERLEMRAESLASALEFTESPAARLRMFDIMLELQNAEMALDSLRIAAESNMDFTEVGEQLNADISARAETAQTRGLFTPEMVATLEQEFARWAEEKAEFDTAQAELRAEEERARREAEEEMRLEDEAARREAAAEAEKAAEGAKAPAQGR